MRASAGFFGEDVRGDCRATVWRDPNPNIEIHSKVKALYGEAIETQARDVMRLTGAQNVSLLIEDTGALPFTIGARIEAALLALDGGLGTAWRPSLKRGSSGSSRIRARRSRLYLPGNTPKFFINAALHKPDAVILDLEDSVPGDEKLAARILVRNALLGVDFGSCERMVRINSGGEGLNDARAVAEAGADALVIPKVEHAEEVIAIDEAVRRVSDKTVWLVPLIESALGLQNTFEIARSSERVAAVSFGIEDYLRDIGAERADWAKAQFVNSARAAGVVPLGPVFTEIDDEEALERNTKDLASLGFEGVSCIHPRQVRVVHRAFAPTDEEVVSARAIIEAFREAGGAATKVGGRMVDAPVAARAGAVLRRAGLAAEDM
jgi:citrate lyase subunit beta/citryl-CoA lyase